MLGDVRLARNKTTAVTCHGRLTKSSHDYTVYIYSIFMRGPSWVFHHLLQTTLRKR